MNKKSKKLTYLFWLAIVSAASGAAYMITTIKVK